MKKWLLLLLSFILLLLNLSASEIKMGCELGYGIDKIYNAKANINSNVIDANYILNRGISLHMVGEYDFNRNVAIKVTSGLMFSGKPKLQYANPQSALKLEKQNTGISFNLILDFKYIYEVNSKFSISVLGGFEFLTGYIIKLDSDKDTVGLYDNVFGLNLGFEFAYKVKENTNLNVGIDIGWLCIHDIDFKSSKFYYWTYQADNNFIYRPYVGCTYAF